MSENRTEQKRRIVVFGGNNATYFFAINAINKGFDVIVFSDPYRLDCKINDGRTLKEAMESDNIKYIETIKITKELVSSYIDNDPIGISIVTFWIFKDDIIELFNGRLYNYHGARLPEEKGGGTFTWKTLSQSYKGGLTIHKIDSGIDTGPIVLQKKFSFPESCKKPIDFEIYKDKLEKNLLEEFILKLAGTFPPDEQQQQTTNSYYWPLLNTNINGVINWDWDYKNIEIFINAFDDPYEGASTEYKNKRVYIRNCTSMKSELQFHPFQSGIIIRKDKEGIYVAALGGILKIKNVLNEASKDITQNVKLGERLYSPISIIDHSLRNKAKYDFRGIKNKVLRHKEKNSISFHEMDFTATDELHEIFTEQDFCLKINEEPHKTINDTEKYITNSMHRNNSYDINNVEMEWIIKRPISEKVIGICRVKNCDYVHRNAEIKLALISSYCTNNMIREAYGIIIEYCLKELKIHKLQSIIPCGFKDIVTICQSLGFKIEGELREECITHDGTRANSLMLGLIESEFAREVNQ